MPSILARTVQVVIVKVDIIHVKIQVKIVLVEIVQVKIAMIGSETLKILMCLKHDFKLMPLLIKIFIFGTRSVYKILHYCALQLHGSKATALTDLPTGRH